MAFAILSVMVLASMSGIFSQQYEDKWWDANWHFRVGIEINNTGYNRTNWTVEYAINFTQVLHNMSLYETFDENSTRVVEYNSSGSILHEIPSQFDKGDGYAAGTNAAGTVVFTMNGTTVANQKRYFYVYFDTLEHGSKAVANYATDLVYNYTGGMGEFNINNSLFRWWMDTERGENTSGIYYVRNVRENTDDENEILRVNDSNNMTVEYSQLSNATDRFGFDFRNNATFKYAGPVRIVVEQRGDEVYWNQPDNKTNEGYMIKRYTFYRYSDWIKIEQIYVNNASYNITRNSTVAGALALDIYYSFMTSGYSTYSNMSNTIDPGSYGWASEATGTWWIGILNLYENGTSNFFGLEDSTAGRLGIQLNLTNISAGSSIRHVAAIQFNGSGQAGQEEYFRNFVNQSITSLDITTLGGEAWTVVTGKKFYMNATNEASIFNRNESIRIWANITDHYNLSKFVNASLNLGGAGELNLTLYDDGAHGDGGANDSIYAYTYNLSDAAAVGVWNATFRVYNVSGYLLNTSSLTFNVTNVYNVTVNISNPTGFTERLINTTVYVKNFRGDSWITGASLNCAFDSTPVPSQNITDKGNGTYNVLFTAPSYAGLFTLACNATRNNNTGYATEEFTCETYTTNITIMPTPQNFTAANVTSYSNQTFNLSVFALNTANGTAYDMNLSLVFSTPNITANVTQQGCGNVFISKNCTKTFQVIITSLTPQGNYTANISASWRNSNASVAGHNSTIMNITVMPNPILNVSDTYMIALIAAGKVLRNIKNVTVYSLGNEPLSNVSFNVFNFGNNFTFGFVPANLTLLGAGTSQSVEIWLNATADTPPGEYNGTINVTTSNDGSKAMNLTIAVSGTNMSLVLDKYNFTAENVTWYQNQSFPLYINTSNMGNSTAYNVSMMLNFSDTNITSSANTYACGNVPKGALCNASFAINILNRTHSGNYTINVSIQWEDPDQGTSSNTTLFNITVTSHINLSIPQNSISNNVTHGTEKEIGILILNSTGNDPVENINFTVYNFSSDFTFEFIPSSISWLGGEYPQGLKINATVRYGQPPGTYAGILNVTSSNSGNKAINLTLEVPTSMTWNMSATYCEKVESPEEGTACEIVVNNTGNVIVNYSITPVANATNMFNYTWTNKTSFVVPNGTFVTFAVLYNITNQTIKFYYANYTVDALQGGSSPDSLLLQIILNPFIKPNVEVFVYPNMTEQTDGVWIYANVTDQSGAGIADGNVTATVRKPDGTNSTVAMLFYSGVHTGGVSRWKIQYPSNFSGGANTTLKGYYNISIFAIDGQGKNTTHNTTAFLIYYKLFVELNASQHAYRGDSLEIRLRSHDALGAPLPGASVNLTLTDPNGGNKDYYMWGGKYFVTDSNGDAGGFYLIPSNAILGNYTFASNASYNETTVSRTIQNTSSLQFDVRDVSEVSAMADIPDPVYRDKVMPISIFILDHGECVQTEPDTIELTIYYTEGYSLQQWRRLTKLNLTQNSTCFYTYGELIGSNVLTGSYLAVLRVGYGDKEAWDLKAFRITTGGPYDVAVNMLETSVPKADYVDFELLLTNMGGTTPDVLVEYWVSGANQTWDYRSESIMVNAYANRTLLRSLYIRSDQSVGQYYVNAKVTYDPINNLYAIANSSFTVTEAAAEQPPGGAPGGGAEEGGGAAISSAPPKIEIIRYPQELGMELDTVKYPVVEVKNSGGSKLYNVTLRLSGIPSPWVQEITPKVIPEIPVGNISIFTITLKIPPTAEAKEYAGQIIADANITKDEKTFSLTLFTTRAQLISWEIDRLKKALQQFEVDVESAKKAGKNVKDVTPYIDQIKEQIRLAEDYLGKKMYDESLSAVQSGWSMLEKARYLLAQAPFTEILIETIFPPWLIALLVVLVVAIAILLFFVRRMKGVFDRIFRMQAPGGGGAAKPSVMVEKMKERENLGKEEMNIRKVMGLLERQYKEGLITENAYMSLKARNEEKLAKIEQMKAAMK